MKLLEEFTTSYDGSSITLRAYLTMPDAEHPDMVASGLRVDVTDAVSFPRDIFVWERQECMLDNGTMSIVQRPVCVAKPSDLNVYPEKSPVSGDTGLPPFYRDTFLSFFIEAPELVLDTWVNIKLDVTNLVKTVMLLGGPSA